MTTHDDAADASSKRPYLPPATNPTRAYLAVHLGARWKDANPELHRID